MSQDTDTTANFVQTEDLKILTVSNLLEDFKQYPGNAEVAVAMHGINLSIPVGYVTHAKCDNGKEFVLLVVAPAAMKRAYDFLEKMEAKNTQEHTQQ